MAARAGEPVLAADTLVFRGAEIFGKPSDAADARRMLGALEGREHSVVTGVALAAGAPVVVEIGRAHV